jgi:hypothetical protein
LHYFYFLENGVITKKRLDLRGESIMPDWFTHTLIGGITGKITKIDIGLIVIDSLIPDLVKENKCYVYFN